MAYITQQDLEDALGVVVVRALYDDDNSGLPDASPLAALIRGATSKVNSYLRRKYKLPIPDPVPDIVWSLTVDVACAMAKERHPEVVRVDGERLMKRAMADLELLRDGKIELDIPLLPEALNERVEMRRGQAGVNGATGTPTPLIFNNGIGDYSK